MTVGSNEISNTQCEKLLGVKIENNLSFNEYVSDLCNKASRKLNALTRIASFISLDKRKVLMKVFIHR